MQSTELLGGDWYPSLGLAWADPFDDQRLAGGILWAGGEFVAVAMLAALVVQWMRQSEREARRVDRALDRAEAAELAAAARRDAGRRLTGLVTAHGQADADRGRLRVLGTISGQLRRCGEPAMTSNADRARDHQHRAALQRRRAGPRRRCAWPSAPARPPDLSVRFVEAASHGEVIRLVDRDDFDLLVLDGEAAPSGGLGIARQLKDEVDDCPPTCVVIARAADRWLAAYARVDATLMHPLDPFTTGSTVAAMLRDRAAGVPVLR